MDKKALLYGFIGLVGGSVLTGLLTLDSTQAQQNPANSSTAAPGCMGMMGNQQADRHFIEMMIPHHEGAVEMANLALAKAKRPEIKKLAEAIKKDQTREIAQMQAWYKQWYSTEVPERSASMGMGMSQGHSGMPMNRGRGMMGMGRMGMGMMPGMDVHLDTLTNAPDFDKAFIQEMIPHHQMAVMMSRMIANSSRPEMRELGQAIIQSQTAEINQMQQWYQTWYRASASK